MDDSSIFFYDSRKYIFCEVHLHLFHTISAIRITFQYKHVLKNPEEGGGGDEEPEREQWSNKLDFLLSVVGYVKLSFRSTKLSQHSKSASLQECKYSIDWYNAILSPLHGQVQGLPNRVPFDKLSSK